MFEMGRLFLSDARRALPASLTSLAAIRTSDLTIDTPARAAGNLLRAGIHHAHVGGRPKHQLQMAQKPQLNYLSKSICVKTFLDRSQKVLQRSPNRVFCTQSELEFFPLERGVALLPFIINLTRPNSYLGGLV